MPTKSDKLDISTFWIELSGTAAENASYALELSSEHLQNMDNGTAAKILEQIYITLWSKDSFVFSFKRSQKLKINVITKNKQASFSLFSRCHSRQLLQQMNDSISAVSQITGIYCGIIEDTTVTEMKTESVGLQEYVQMMSQSQVYIMQLIKHNAHRASTIDESTQTLETTLTPDPAVLNETKPKQLLETEDQPALDEGSETEQLPAQQPVMDLTQEICLQTTEPFTSSSAESRNETQPKQIVKPNAPQVKPGKKEPEPLKKMGTVQLPASDQTNINAETIQHLTITAPQAHFPDFRALGEKLKKDLWSQAEARSRFLETAVEIKKVYEMAQLEIAENAPMQANNYNYETSFQQREKLLQRFSQSTGNIKIKEIFEKLQAYTESQKATHSQTVVINRRQLRNAPTSQTSNHNIIGVIGQAGIGKTTFTKMLVQQVLSKQILKSVSFLFYLFVREINFSRDCNVLQFLVRSALPEWKFAKKQDDTLLEYVNGDENVLVVIDGFDEALLSNAQYAKVSIYDEASPELILLNLMSGHILPFARKVVTSRPAEMFQLRSPVRPPFLLQILGLSQESQDILGQQICGDSYKDLKTMLYKHPDLSLYWYVPIYCIMAFSYFANDKTRISESFTFTSLLTMTFIDYVSTDHMRGNGVELEKFANLAWIGILSKQCIFRISDLKQVGLDYSTVQAFFQMALSKGLRFNMSILQGDQLIFFSHLIWQEYFASVYLCLVMSVAEFQQHVQGHMIRNSAVVLKFIFGLCNREVYTQLQSVIPISSEAWVAKKRCLYSFVEKLGLQTGTVFQKLLEYSSLLLEAQDESMLQAYISGISSTYVSTPITLQGSLLPSDVASFCYLLRGFQNQNMSIRGINIATSGTQNRCTFIGDAFTRLALEIGSGLKLEELKLSGIQFGDEGANTISTCVTTVKHLHINKCNITQKGLPKIVARLLELDDPMTELKLGQNNLTDVGAELLAPCIPYIQQLHLDNCNITEVGVQKIAQNVVLLNGSMQLLNLSGNKVGNKGAAALAEGLHKIKQLILLMCHITEEGTTILATKAKNLPSQMDLLDLSENKIGEEAIQAFSHCEGKIGTLRLVFCSMNASQKELLKDINVEY